MNRYITLMYHYKLHRGANSHNSGATARVASQKSAQGVPALSGLLGYHFENEAYSGFLVLLMIKIKISYFLNIFIITLPTISIYLEVKRLGYL